MATDDFYIYLSEGFEDALFKGENSRYERDKNKPYSPYDIPHGYSQGFLLGLKFYRKFYGKWRDNNEQR